MQKKFVNKLPPEVLKDLANELNRDGRWKDFLAVCLQKNFYQFSDSDCDRLKQLSGHSVWESAGFKLLHEMGNQGLTVEEACGYLRQLHMEKALALIQGPEPLVITEEPEAMTCLLEGQQLVLRCRARGFPSPQYRWYQKTADGEMRKLDCIKDTLHIYDINRSNEGKYLCRVFNSEGYYLNSKTSLVEVNKNPAHSQVRATEHQEECAPTLPAAHHPRPGHAGEGWENHPPRPEPHPHWADVVGDQCDSHPHMAGSAAEVYDHHHRPGPEEGYHYPGDDWDHHPRPIHAPPTHAPCLPQWPLPPLVYPAEVQVEEGYTVELQCQAQGRDLMYRWFRNDQPLDQMELAGFTELNAPYLQISGCQLFHAGNYNCMVYYPGGACHQSNAAKLHVFDASCKEKPVISRDLPASESIHIGEELTLRVAVRCGQHLTYQWFFNGGILPGEINPDLKFIVKSTDAEGKYQCRITTEQGSEVLSNQTRLKVHQNSCFRAHDKVALIVGNSVYQAQDIMPLPTVCNDVKLMESKLAELGFKVISLVNLEKQEMEVAIKEFCLLLDQGIYGVFMFSGHGFEVDHDHAYMVPFDAAGTMPPEDCVSVNWMVQRLQQQEPALLFLILDICRERPESLERVGIPDIPYEPPVVLGNTIFYYATSHGKPALEPKTARNSVFVKCLSEVIDQKCDIRQLFPKVMDELKKTRANKIQFPELKYNLKDARMLSDPIDTTGHTQAMNANFMRWQAKSVLPKTMRRVERETGAQFQLRFRKQFNNVLVMDISYDNQELEVFSSGIDQVPPEVNMLSSTRGECMSYEIEALQKLVSPLIVSVMLEFVHRDPRFGGRRIQARLPLNLEWPLVAAGCRPMQASMAPH